MAGRPHKPNRATPRHRSRPDPAPVPGPEAPAEPERLQKVLAHAGVGSRRACEELILQGRVTVDGQVVRTLGTRVDGRHAQIAVDGQSISAERPVYYAVWKPRGYVSTNHDPAGRPRVVDLLPEVPQRVYAVGRLDEASVGLMLLTNDGALANRLTHPRFGVEKVYRVLVAGRPAPEVLEKVSQGVWLAEGKVRARHVKVVGRRGDATVLEVILAEGKNREIRRMLASLGHKVMSLMRVAIGPIRLKGLKPGQARPLSAHEVERLRRAAAGLPVGPEDERARAAGPRQVEHGRRPGRAPRAGRPAQIQPRRPPARPQRPPDTSPATAAGAPQRAPARRPQRPPLPSGPSGPRIVGMPPPPEAPSDRPRKLSKTRGRNAPPRHHARPLPKPRRKRPPDASEPGAAEES